MDKERYPETFSCSDYINKNDLQLVDGKAPIWWNYFLCGVKGVVGELLQNDDLHSGSNGANEENHCGYIALMDGKIPPSAGLSSSSAVVVAAALSMFKYSYNGVINPSNHKKSVFIIYSTTIVFRYRVGMQVETRSIRVSWGLRTIRAFHRHSR